jgi:quercetin dioxygenase-like cupin family protein
MHTVCRSGAAAFEAPADWAVASTGMRRWQVIDAECGAVHTGFAICELEPGGVIAAHVHSYEQSFFMIEGSAVLQTGGDGARSCATALAEGDYGLVPVGVPHTWRNEGTSVARWADMQAPQPRRAHGGDTFVVPPLRPQTPSLVDVRDPRTRSFGHIAPASMDPAKQTQDMLAVSASMRTALLVYSGITVKMMVDSDLGAVLSTMFMVAYSPGGFAGAHDHPFEETYLILEGEVQAAFDGERYLLGPGDVAWAGAGCVHAFECAGPAPVRWLETQAPQPPARHSYRFARDWDYLADRLRKEG